MISGDSLFWEGKASWYAIKEIEKLNGWIARRENDCEIPIAGRFHACDSVAVSSPTATYREMRP
jgi:hypothetical protein